MLIVSLTAPRISWEMGLGACLLGSISIPFIDVGRLCCGQGTLGAGLDKAWSSKSKEVRVREVKEVRVRVREKPHSVSFK